MDTEYQDRHYEYDQAMANELDSAYEEQFELDFFEEDFD